MHQPCQQRHNTCEICAPLAGPPHRQKIFKLTTHSTDFTGDFSSKKLSTAIWLVCDCISNRLVLSLDLARCSAMLLPMPLAASCVRGTTLCGSKVAI